MGIAYDSRRLSNALAEPRGNPNFCTGNFCIDNTSLADQLLGEKGLQLANQHNASGSLAGYLFQARSFHTIGRKDNRCR